MVEVAVARWGLSRGGGMVVVVVDGGAVVVGDGSCEVARWRDVCGWMGAMLGCVDPRPRQQYAPHPSPTSHRTCGDGGEQRVATGMHVAITRHIGHVYRATHSLTSAPMATAKGNTVVYGGQGAWWWLRGTRRDASGQ